MEIVSNPTHFLFLLSYFCPEDFLVLSQKYNFTCRDCMKRIRTMRSMIWGMSGNGSEAWVLCWEILKEEIPINAHLSIVSFQTGPTQSGNAQWLCGFQLDALLLHGQKCHGWTVDEGLVFSEELAIEGWLMPPNFRETWTPPGIGEARVVLLTSHLMESIFLWIFLWWQNE